MLIQPKNLPKILLGVIILLLIPLFGNVFVDGWMWSGGDFIFAFVFLLIAGLVFDYVRRKFTKPVHRTLACVLVVLVFVVIWAELAVGWIEEIVSLFL